jgi:hypothetical protein
VKRYQYRSIDLPVPADVAGPELERIWSKHGKRLEPAHVVEAARPAKAPLHPSFNWDDKSAAKQFRLQQARQLIRSIQIIADDSSKPRSLFVHVNLEPEGGKRRKHYQHVDTILGHPTEYLAALIELRRKLISISEAVEELKSLAEKDATTDELRKFSLITEALTTARTVAERLQ